MSDLKFLDSLKEYDRDNIPQHIITRIRSQYINNPEFNPVLIKNQSSACEGLCRWIISISLYDEINKMIMPKKERLRNAQETLRVQMIELESKRKELAVVSVKLDELNSQLAIKQREQEELLTKITAIKNKLERAESLTSGLGGEKIRWNNVIENLTHKYDNIVGDVLLSSAIVAYLGAFTVDYRQVTF